MGEGLPVFSSGDVRTLTSLGFRRVVLSRSRERRALFASQQDGRENGVGLLKYIVVPEPEHLPAESFEMLRAPRVAVASVLATIGFDNDLGFDASEVGDERPDSQLSTKFETVEPSAVQVKPQPLLGIG